MDTVSRRGAIRAAGGAAAAGALAMQAIRPDTALAVAASDLVVSVVDQGAVGNGTTDDSAAVQRAINLVEATGGTVFFPVGTYRIDSQLVLPNNRAAIPLQRPVKLLGQGCHFSGRGTAIHGGTILDLRSTTGPAKIDTRGLGLLEMTGLTLWCSTNDSNPFIQTTNTTLHIHDCAFETQQRALACDVDAIVLGGTVPQAGGAATDGFQGYGTIICGNYFQGIRRAVYGRTWANGTVIESNTVWNTSGTNLAGGGCIEIDGNSAGGSPIQYAVGNVIANNLIEVANYPYGVKLDHAAENSVVHNNFYDNQRTSLAAVRIETQGIFNLLIDGFVPGALPALSEASPGTTTRICPHQSVPNIFHVLQASQSLKLGAAGDVELVRLYPHVMAMPVSDCFRTGADVSGNRPNARSVGVGAQWYDVTLRKPIWSDGANWKDAAGTLV